MTSTVLSRTFTTRERYRADIEAALGRVVADNKLGAHETFDPPLTLEEGEAEIPVVTVKALDEALQAIFRDDLPPPDEKAAEVRTPAFLTIWARCPNCGIHMVIPVAISPVLTLGDGVGELKIKATSKGRIHACNQLTLDEPNGQQAAFAADSTEIATVMVETTVDVSDDADETGDDASAPDDALVCVGSNHVPGCEHFAAKGSDAL